MAALVQVQYVPCVLVLLPQIPDREEENEMLVGVLPDRVGHATFLHRGQYGAMASVVQTVLKEKIPLGFAYCHTC